MSIAVLQIISDLSDPSLSRKLHMVKWKPQHSDFYKIRSSLQ